MGVAQEQGGRLQGGCEEEAGRGKEKCSLTITRIAGQAHVCWT
jgi:hypothetical protein